MKRYRIVLWCAFILIFINVVTACTPPTPTSKSEDKEAKTFSQMSTDEIEEAAESAFVAKVRKESNLQYGRDYHFDGYDIDDIRYRITDISIDRTEEKATVKGYMYFYNDYDESETCKFTCYVVFEEDGDYYAYDLSLFSV